MDDEKLILLVKENDILYNKYNKYYRLPEKKRAVWSRISKEMSLPLENCIKRWNSLRDRFAKEKKNERMASGSGAIIRHRWHLMSLLEFLTPHLAQRAVKCFFVKEEAMDDEKLILLVEENDILYNKFNKYYRLPEKKRAVWSRISKEMSLPQENCIKRWNSLRDRFVKEKKNERMASGSGTMFRHRWHLMSLLEFLTPHVAPRAVRSTVNIVEENEFISNDNSFQASKIRKNKNQFDDTDKLFMEAVETFKQFCKSEEEKQQQKDRDPINAFGKMVVATINTLSKTKQTKAMNLITELLMQVKLEPE